jgi:tetratricopeptide (TPR) repeat protein
MEKGAEAVRVASDEVLALAHVARQSAEQGRLDDARMLLEGLIALEPRFAYLQTCLGCVYMRMGRNDEALVWFEDALALDPKDVAAHTYAGELRLERGETALAVTHLESAIGLDPDGRNAFANRARTLRLTVPPEGQAKLPRGNA